ncbi:MAG: allophanate hydrolase subunit 1 [Alphaproteobacteria bacterium]|jgi:urea carboxylase|nr:allophanate hydrolase subunit 1 [Alphaproteobacteria bacterium]
MIYDEPKFLPGGDRYVLVEFGNEMNLELNFTAQGLATKIEEQKTKGIVETAPCFASMLVHYEPNDISFDDVVKELKALIADLGPTDNIELSSRIFYFETLYLDPWTKECIDDYSAKITEKEYDPDFVARINGLEDRHQLVRVHSGTEYWVASLGFWPGLPFLQPLDPRSKITAPKYNPPRTWTPQGAIGMGGSASSIYPVQTPGGYQLFGRTPVPIWDTEKRFDAFGGEIVLFRPGDRLKYVPCTLEEYEHTEARIKDGTYVYNMVDYQKFSVRNYKSWVKTINADDRF